MKGLLFKEERKEKLSIRLREKKYVRKMLERLFFAFLSQFPPLIFHPITFPFCNSSRWCIRWKIEGPGQATSLLSAIETRESIDVPLDTSCA